MHHNNINESFCEISLTRLPVSVARGLTAAMTPVSEHMLRHCDSSPSVSSWAETQQLNDTVHMFKGYIYPVSGNACLFYFLLFSSFLFSFIVCTQGLTPLLYLLYGCYSISPLHKHTRVEFFYFWGRSSIKKQSLASEGPVTKRRRGSNPDMN